MKLYDAFAPNPRRVRIFMAEKGIEIPIVTVALLEGETRKPEFLALNSLGETPVLELDNGRILTESMAICRYLEALYPEKPLFGVGAEEQAFIEMWSRRMEHKIMAPIGAVGLHTFPFFADTVEQNADYAASQRRLLAKQWAWFNNEMSDGRPFVAGDAFTVADITGMAALMICDFMEEPLPEGLEHALAWQARVQSRPTAQG